MTKMSVLAAAAAMGALGTIPAYATSTNLIGNGSFENGLTGYSVSGIIGVPTGGGPQVITYGPGATAYGDTVTPDPFSFSPTATGTHALYFVDDNAHEVLSENTQSLTAGVTYEIGFDFFKTISGAANANGFALTEALGGTALTSFTSTSAYTTANWYHIFDTYTATASGPQAFSFTFDSGTSPAGDVIVDDVYVMANGTSPGRPNTPIAVPEPASIATMLAGLLGFAGIRARRRKM